MLELPAEETDHAWALTLSAGTLVGHYEVMRVAARGSLADVCEAFDRTTGRTVALKLFRPGPRLRELIGSIDFRAEADAAGRLDHPNVVSFIDAGQWAGGLYVVSEWFECTTLRERLRARPLPVREVLGYAREIAAALEVAHSSGVVHRNLEPANVLLLPDERLKVTGFGLTRPTAQSLTASATAFFAPEQWRGESGDARSDVFAFGVILFQALTGSVPYAVAGHHTESLDRGATPRPTGAGIPRRLADLVRRCIDRDPARRFRDGAELAQALSGLDSGPTRPFGSPVVLGTIAVVVAALSAGVFFYLRQAGDSSRSAVVVVDEIDQSGNGAFAGAADLLVRALEPSTHLKILSRPRLRRALFGGPNARLDVSALKSAWGDLKARWALVLTIRKLSVGFVGELDAVDPRTGDRGFAVAERADSLDSSVEMLDRLARRARLELSESPSDIDAHGVSLARSVTSDLEAWRFYEKGLECIASSGTAGLTCTGPFRQAVKKDPGFGSAYLSLALLGMEAGSDSDSQRESLELVLRSLPRLPRREEELATGWRAALDGDEGSALGAYRRLAESDPSDRAPPLLAADLLFTEGKLADAVTWLDRLLAKNGDDAIGLSRLARVLGEMNERGRLKTLANRLASSSHTPASLHALSLARGWLGEAQEAAAAADLGRAAGSPFAVDDAIRARGFAGELGEAEKIAREALAAAPPEKAADRHLALAKVLAEQGRWREAAKELDLCVAEPGESDPDVLRQARAQVLAGRGDTATLRNEIADLANRSRIRARPLAITLAYLGDLGAAAPLALELPQGSVALRIYKSVASWNGGDPASGASALRSIAADHQKDAGVPAEAAWFLYGSALVDVGDHNGAVVALRSFQRLYEDDGWHPWALPRSRLLLAKELIALGRRAEASEEMGKLLGSLIHADEDNGFLRAARILQAQVQGH